MSATLFIAVSILGPFALMGVAMFRSYRREGF